jgi:hypothetical protein
MKGKDRRLYNSVDIVPKHCYMPCKSFQQLDSTAIVLSLIVLSIRLRINVLHKNSSHMKAKEFIYWPVEEGYPKCFGIYEVKFSLG